MTTFGMLVLVVLVALAFDFVNGFHDTANSIATVVSTGTLRPRTAIAMAAVCEVIGAFLGTAVAQTVGRDILDPTAMTQTIVLAALLGAISWNLLTWLLGIPSSSSHALVGGLVGAGALAAGWGSIQYAGVEKVVAALLLSPVFGFSASFLVMLLELWVLRRIPTARVNVISSRLQIPSAAFLAISHGLNDAQKTMGVITAALLTYQGGFDPGSDFSIPDWVIFACALAMGAGTAMGGWRIIHTMGNRIFKMRPIHGFTSSITAAAVMQLASHYGLPISTTHCVTASVMGAGATQRLSAVRWGVTRQILVAWVLTIPASAVAAGAFYELLHLLGL
jgi:PiT family inorganic phosphate transporter